MTENVYIVAYGRAPVGKGNKHSPYYYEFPENISSQVLKGVLDRISGNFDPSMIDDVIVGCSMPENRQGMNIARKIVLKSGLPNTIPAKTLTRFCASGLEAIATGANQIISGQSDIVVGGGLEFQSTSSINTVELNNNPELEDDEFSIAMGLTAENLADKYNISRNEQDKFAVNSHKKAHHAQKSGRFVDEIIPVKVKQAKRSNSGLDELTYKIIEEDEGIRPDTSIEKLKKLRPVFKKNGTVTAATSSQISDGTSFVVLMSESKVQELNVNPIARYIGYQVVGNDPTMMGIAPVEAINKLLSKTKIKLDDLDVIELNEAFAAQTLAVIKELKIENHLINPNGGAIALGHPNGATGAILTSRLLAEMKKRKDTKYGMVTMCIGGGMGAASIFEYVGNR